MTHAHAGVLLRSMALPSLLHSVALDPSEHRIFLGLESGDIAQASLVEAAPSASELPGSHPALKGHVGPVQCLAVTPDGAMLASGELLTMLAGEAAHVARLGLCWDSELVRCVLRAAVCRIQKARILLCSGTAVANGWGMLPGRHSGLQCLWLNHAQMSFRMDKGATWGAAQCVSKACCCCCCACSAESYSLLLPPAVPEPCLDCLCRRSRWLSPALGHRLGPGHARAGASCQGPRHQSFVPPSPSCAEPARQ